MPQPGRGHEEGGGEPPGGVLELGESIKDGLRRETREETGLDIEPAAPAGACKNMARGITALVFRCKITGGELALTDETMAYRWADEHAIRDLAAEASAIRVLDALHTDHPPAVRHAIPPRRPRRPTRYSNQVQQQLLTAAGQHDHPHTELAGTTDMRPAAPLIRGEEADSTSD